MQATLDAKGLHGDCSFKRSLKALLGGRWTGRGIAEKTGREGRKTQADLSFGEEFQSRERRRLKMRRNVDSGRGDQFGSPIKKEGKAPMRGRGVEPYWLQQSQPADLGGRTKAGKTYGCCWEKMALSVSFSTILTTESAPPSGYSYFKVCQEMGNSAAWWGSHRTTVPRVLWGMCPVKVSLANHYGHTQVLEICSHSYRSQVVFFSSHLSNGLQIPKVRSNKILTSNLSYHQWKL